MKSILAAVAGLSLAFTSLARPEPEAAPAAVQPLQAGGGAGNYFPGWFPPQPPYNTPGVDWWIHPDYLNAGPPRVVVDDQGKVWGQ